VTFDQKRKTLKTITIRRWQEERHQNTGAGCAAERKKERKGRQHQPAGEVGKLVKKSRKKRRKGMKRAEKEIANFLQLRTRTQEPAELKTRAQRRRKTKVITN